MYPDKANYIQFFVDSQAIKKVPLGHLWYSLESGLQPFFSLFFLDFHSGPPIPPGILLGLT